MFRLTEPLTADVRDFLQQEALTAFSYSPTGCTKAKKRPRGYNIDRHRIQLGTGDALFERSKRNLRDWRMFATEWVKLCWPYKKLIPGTVVAIVVSHYGFCSMNAARIVYTVDEPRRFGFAYGTLKSHAERGEELFLVTMHDDKSVWFEMTAISRPAHWLTWLFYPLGRRLQKRFAQDAMHAMLEALTGPDAGVSAAGAGAAMESPQ